MTTLPWRSRRLRAAGASWFLRSALVPFALGAASSTVVRVRDARADDTDARRREAKDHFDKGVKERAQRHHSVIK